MPSANGPNDKSLSRYCEYNDSRLWIDVDAYRGDPEAARAIQAAITSFIESTFSHAKSKTALKDHVKTLLTTAGDGADKNIIVEGIHDVLCEMVKIPGTSKFSRGVNGNDKEVVKTVFPFLLSMQYQKLPKEIKTLITPHNISFKTVTASNIL